MRGGSPKLAIALLGIAVACSDATTAPTSTPTPTSVAVSASSLRFSSLGETAQLTATVHDQNRQVVVGATVAWVSANTSVAIVDQSGLVSAAGNGATTMTAAAGATASAMVAVTVEQVSSTIVFSTRPDSVAVGDSIQMTAEAFDALDNPIVGVTFEWSSSDTTIVTVDQQGWARAKAAGSAVITVELGSLSASTSLVSFHDQAGTAFERAALETFYYATNGAEWRNNTNWLTDEPVGEWYGVTTDAAGKVTRLSLHQNGLRGRLPAELAHLRNLKALRLWGERGRGLTGPIPPELGRLANLTTLNLGNNDLTGEIPPELADLTNLTYLTLTQSKLTGPIPPGLGRLANLEELSLGNNSLTGEIPPEIWNLTELTFLDLGGNDLTGEIPAAVGKLAKLEVLSVISTTLTGSIPPELGGLSQLRGLWMLGNDLTGSIPPELGNLHNLDALLLGGNRLSGPIPPELGALSRLRVLMLSDNPLTGAIPPELGGLTQLQGLHLDGDHLSGPVPPELGSLAELRKLYISNNDLDGRVPDTFLNLDLDEFWWHNNPLCLPATPAFEAWRRRIPLTRGAYCAAGAAAAVEGRRAHSRSRSR